MLDQTTLANRIAMKAHLNQRDKAGCPYTSHIDRVVGYLVECWPGASDEERAAAWLHDVLEDTPITVEYLMAVGISRHVISIVQELTRPNNARYLTWIRTMARIGTLSAVKIKLADIRDNSDPDRVSRWSGGAEMVRTRYAPAKALLEMRVQQDARKS